MNKVMCPWCGKPMTETRCEQDSRTIWFYWCHNCGGEAPTGDTPEAAYAAATRRPENKPLTSDLVMLEDYYGTAEEWQKAIKDMGIGVKGTELNRRPQDQDEQLWGDC